MKKMSMSTLARGNLKGKRKQYLTLFFGVFFAMLFSMSALFFVSSFRASVQAKNDRMYGKADCIILNALNEDWSKLNRYWDEPEFGFGHILGTCVWKGESNIRYSIGWLDKKAMALSNAELIEGAFPTNENEIAIEQTTMLVLDLDDKQIGDKVTLEFQIQNGEDVLPKPIKKTFVLSGILYDKYSNITNRFETSGIPSLLVCENSKPEPGGKENLCAYLCGKDLHRINPQPFWDYVGGPWNQIYLLYERGSYDAYSNTLPLYIVITIFAVSLLLVSCVGIVNAFQSRLSDRKTQIGLLRAVGTTRRQIIGLYNRETLLLCLLATPLAFLGAFFAVRLLLRFIAPEMTFVPQWWVLLGSAAISILVVLLASLVPLRRASRISPMQAIRNTEITRQMVGKKIKSLTSFDVPGLLSKRSRQLFKKRQVLTAMILTVSVLVSAFGFTLVGLYATQNAWLEGDYQVYVFRDVEEEGLIWNRAAQRGWSESEIREMQAVPHMASSRAYGAFPALIETETLTEYDKLYHLSLNLAAEAGEITEENLEQFQMVEQYETVKQLGNYKKELIPVAVVVTTDESLLDMDASALREGSIDLEKINAGQEMLLYAPRTWNLKSRTFIQKGSPDYGEVHYVVENADRRYIDD